MHTTSIPELLAYADETAAEIRTLGDYEKAQTVVAIRAEIARNRLGHGEMARRLCEHFKAEVWRLARH